MDIIELNTLVPMSMEDLKVRKYGNVRRNGLLQLWFVDGLGKAHLLITPEIERFQLDIKWPRYMKTNLGIKTINQLRRENC